MSEPAVGVVVAHARLASALVGAAENISGVEDALHPISNEGCTPEELLDRVDRAIGDRPALLFVDMAAGSCALAGRRAAGSRDGVVVVTGVSLPMLLDFLFHRELDVDELADRVVNKGRSAVARWAAARGADGDRADQG